MRRTVYVTAAVILMLSLSACASNGSSTDSSLASLSPATADPMIYATEEFNSAVKRLSDAKATLSGLLQEAETLLNDVPAEDVADTSVLEGLSIVFESATGAVEVSVPSMKSEAEEVRLQAQEIQNQADDIWSIYHDMESAIESVKTSQQDLLDNKRRESVGLGEEYVGHVKSQNGYTAEYTVSTTGWIKACDAELLQLAWENVAGDGSMVPSISQFHSTANDGFTEANAAVAFGRLIFRNTTQGFDITEESPVTFSIIPGMSSENHEKWTKGILTDVPEMYLKLSQPMTTDFRGTARTRPISPLMKGNTWGPVAFMVVYPNAITPKDPEGTKLNDFPLIFSEGFYGIGEGVSIEIKPSW